MEPNPSDQSRPDSAVWNANDDLFNLSILCRLEPRNKAASQVLAFNRHKASRVVTLSTEHGAAVEMLQVGFQEPKQRRGLVMFGRYPGCSVQFPDPKVSLDHCYLDLNPMSGVLMVYNTSKNGTTWLDSEQVLTPPHRAMVSYHSKTLRVHRASFQIHWPKIAERDLPQYQSRILALACSLHADREIFDLTDLEHDLVSLPPTAPATRPASRHATPFSEPNDNQNPIKLEELGRGAYGIVWKAVERLTGNLIAIKQLHKTTHNRMLLEREITHMSGLRHVRIAPFYPFSSY
jgi:FHA domain